MFRFTRKPSSGNHSQYLAKITHLVQCGYLELVQDVSVMAAYCDLWGIWTVHCVRVYCIPCSISWSRREQSYNSIKNSLHAILALCPNSSAPHCYVGCSYLLRNCASLMMYFVITFELCRFVLFMQCFPFCVWITRAEKESISKPRKYHLTQLKPVTRVKWEAELNNITCHTSQLPKKITA